MSPCADITLAVAPGFEGRVARSGDVHIQQNKLQVGIKEAKWVGEWV